MQIDIELVKESDLKDLAVIYKQLYDNAEIGEFWTEETALQLFNYWLKTQPDLFFCAYVDNKPVGAVMAAIKPWWDGIHLTDTEIFVSKEYQKFGIARMLYKKHFEVAMQKYNATIMEAHTYKDENGFPFSWYEKLGFEADNELYIIHGDVKEAYKKL